MNKEKEALHSVLIGIKAYSSDGTSTLRAVVDELSAQFQVQSVSSIYKVSGVGEKAGHIHDLRGRQHYDGLCVVLRAFTRGSPEESLGFLQQTQKRQSIEAMHRNVSINLLVFDDYTAMTPHLTLPHPEFHLQPEFFVPAGEIWGDYIHPILRTSISSLATPVPYGSWGEFYAQGKTLLDF